MLTPERARGARVCPPAGARPPARVAPGPQPFRSALRAEVGRLAGAPRFTRPQPASSCSRAAAPVTAARDGGARRACFIPAVTTVGERITGRARVTTADSPGRSEREHPLDRIWVGTDGVECRTVLEWASAPPSPRGGGEAGWAHWTVGAGRGSWDLRASRLPPGGGPAGGGRRGPWVHVPQCRTRPRQVGPPAAWSRACWPQASPGPGAARGQGGHSGGQAGAGCTGGAVVNDSSLRGCSLNLPSIFRQPRV